MKPTENNIDKKDSPRHEISGTYDASHSNLTTLPEKSPMVSDTTANHHSIRGDQPDSSKLKSTVVKTDSDTEKGFTPVTSQDNDVQTAQGHWREKISVSWSKWSVILQIFVWLVFTA